MRDAAKTHESSVSTTDSVSELRDTLAATVRKRAHDQVELWKRVPWLSLQADGRTGFGPSHYLQGYLPVAQTAGWYTVYVDLDTGDLVNASHVEQIAPDSAIMDLDIDAEKIVARLEERAQVPHGSYYDVEQQEEWRRRMAEGHGITERYERNGPRKNLPMVWD